MHKQNNDEHGSTCNRSNDKYNQTCFLDHSMAVYAKNKQTNK